MEVNDKVLITVITPAYNISEVILETFHSLQAQTYEHFEWLIVDDGSTLASSLELFEYLVKQDERIRVVSHTVNKGLPAARNTGIRNANTDYLFFIDADDLIHPTTLEKFFITLELNPAFEFVNSFVRGFGAQQYSWTGGFSDGEVFMTENRNTSCFMARKKVFPELLFDESLTEGCEDWDFWLHAASLGYWGYTIPEFLFMYRRSDSSDKWNTLSSKQKYEKMGLRLRKKYEPTLQSGNFPSRTFSNYSFGPLSGQKVRVANSPTGEKKNNILFIIPWLEIGGADKFNLDLLNGLHSKEWSLTIACTISAENKWLDQFEKVTKDIFLLPEYSNENDLYKTVEYLILSRDIRLVLLTNSMYGYYLSPYLKQRFPAVPLVDYLHCEEEMWYNGGYPMFSAVYDKVLSRTFVSSDHLKNWCTSRGKDGNRITTVYTNIDTSLVKRNSDIRASLRKKLKLTDDTVVILFVGRLTHQKQPDVLVQALGGLYEKNRDFACIILGDGPEKNALIRNINRSAASRRIHYLGAVPNEEVMNYMDAADVFFLPSQYEGIALSIFEAMSKGLAIVGADVGGQRELVTKDCGTLIKRSNPARESADYAEALYEYVRSAERAHQAGQAGRTKVEIEFDIRHMIDKMDHALRHIIAGHKPERSEISDEYMIAINRMLMLTTENQILASKTGRPFAQLPKDARYYKVAKKVYHKFKRLAKYNR